MCLQYPYILNGGSVSWRKMLANADGKDKYAQARVKYYLVSNMFM